MGQVVVSVVTAVGALLGAVLVGVLSAQIPWWLQRRTAEKEEQRRRKAMLALFAWEAVFLQGRWVQYRRQAKDDALSFSRPVEITDGKLLAELIRLEPSDDLVVAIHKVKQLNADVMTQIVRAQEEYSRAAGQVDQEGGVITPNDQPFKSFRAASAFIRDDWDVVKHAIKVILDSAKAAGVPMEAVEKVYDDNVKEYESPAPTSNAKRRSIV